MIRVLKSPIHAPLKQTFTTERLCQEKIKNGYADRIKTEMVSTGEGALRIIATGLLIFIAALSMKYGMNPCIRFSPASDSDASSDAM